MRRITAKRKICLILSFLAVALMAFPLSTLSPKNAASLPFYQEKWVVVSNVPTGTTRNTIPTTEIASASKGLGGLWLIGSPYVLMEASVEATYFFEQSEYEKTKRKYIRFNNPDFGPGEWQPTNEYQTTPYWKTTNWALHSFRMEIAHGKMTNNVYHATT